MSLQPFQYPPHALACTVVVLAVTQAPALHLQATRVRAVWSHLNTRTQPSTTHWLCCSGSGSDRAFGFSRSRKRHTTALCRDGERHRHRLGRRASATACCKRVPEYRHVRRDASSPRSHRVSSRSRLHSLTAVPHLAVQDCVIHRCFRCCADMASLPATRPSSSQSSWTPWKRGGARQDARLS